MPAPKERRNDVEAKVIMTVDEMQKDRKAWLEARRQGIGGSDIAVLLGISKWRTPFSLWQEKTSTAYVEDGPTSEEAHFGLVLEEVVAREFEERTGKKVRRCGMLRRDDAPWAIASVDRLVVGEDAGLECKTTAGWRSEDWLEDRLPDAYFLQCQWYMYVTGFKRWYIACLIGGNHFVWKEVKRSDEDVEAMAEAAAKFWQENVVEKKLPAVDASADCTRALNEYYGADGGPVLHLDDSFEQLCQDIIDMNESCKKMEDAVKLKKNQLKQMLAETTVAQTSSYNIFNKIITQHKVDNVKLKLNYPKVYEECMYITTARPLLIKKSRKRPR